MGGRSECGKCGILYGANKKPKVSGICDKCGQSLKERDDDKDIEAIKRRLDAYHSEIETMVNYYQWKGVLRRIDAASSVEEVFRKVLETVKK